MSTYGGVFSTRQDVDFCVISLITIITGVVLRYYASAATRKYIGSLLGISIVGLFCGKQGVFVYFTVGLTILWMSLSKSFQPKCQWIFSVLILCSRMLFGFSEEMIGILTHDKSIANTIHMFISLRCISLMYEICEFRNPPIKVSKICPKVIAEEPTILNAICYFFYPPAICLGPFYTYQTFTDFSKIPQEKLKSVPFTNLIIKKLVFSLFLCGYLYIKATYLGYIFENMETYHEQSFSIQLTHVIAEMFVTGCFLSAVWLAGECTCIAFGLGAYTECTQIGKGPSEEPDKIGDQKDKTYEKPKWNYITISNGNSATWFIKPTVAALLRDWNATVQWWLARYVFTNRSLKKQSRFNRFVITQLVNAIWHGSAMGYFLSLLGLAVTDALENIYLKMVNKWIKTEQGIFTSKIIKHLSVNIVLLSYVMLPFFIGSFEKTKIIFYYNVKPLFLILSISCFIIVIIECIFRNISALKNVVILKKKSL